MTGKGGRFERWRVAPLAGAGLAAALLFFGWAMPTAQVAALGVSAGAWRLIAAAVALVAGVVVWRGLRVARPVSSRPSPLRVAELEPWPELLAASLSWDELAEPPARSGPAEPPVARLIAQLESGLADFPPAPAAAPSAEPSEVAVALRAAMGDLQRMAAGRA